MMDKTTSEKLYCSNYMYWRQYLVSELSLYYVVNDVTGSVQLLSFQKHLKKTLKKRALI